MIEVTNEGADTFVVEHLRRGNETSLALLRAAIQKLAKNETWFHWSEVFAHVTSIAASNAVIEEYGGKDAILSFEDMVWKMTEENIEKAMTAGIQDAIDREAYSRPPTNRSKPKTKKRRKKRT